MRRCNPIKFIAAILLFSGIVSTSVVYAVHSKPNVVYQPPPVIVQTDSLTEWQVFIMSLIEVECERNPKARSNKNAIGPFQITPIYVEEVNRLYNTNFTHEDAWDINKSLTMFEMMNDKYNPEKNIDSAIKIHNPNAGKWYNKRIKDRMELIKFNEQVRSNVIELYNF